MATQRWPTAWLFTDERLGEELPMAMARAAAAGAGILVRHYRSSPDERLKLARQVRELGAPLAMAGDVALARESGAVFVHNPEGPTGDLPFSLAVHDEAQALAAAARQAACVFISPIYPTRSHPGAAALGPTAALELARLCRCPAYALGRMDAVNGEALMKRGFAGWAGIDCWLRT